MSRITRALLALLLLALAAPAAATAAPSLVPIGTFDQPVHAASPPGDTSRLFVVEQRGVVRVVRDGVTLPAPFLDISGEVLSGGERGLLSIAFPPDHATSGLFYVYLTAPGGELQVREYQRLPGNPDVASSSGRIVWRQAHPNGNHNGAQIAFGPDGMLWLAPGDGGSNPGAGESDNDPGNDAQTITSQLGKVLRIDPRPNGSSGYTVPPDNPYGTAVWASGLRNPFRFSFDRLTGDLTIGDVGGGAREEIDFAPRADGLGRAANFGWPCREGFTTGPRSCPGGPFADPVFDYQQASPRAITGGFVVRDPGLPTLAGRYLYADTYAGQVRSLILGRPLATDDRPEAGLQRDLLVAFAEDACGRLYVVSLNGTVDRIQDGAASPCPPPPRPPPPPTFPDRTSPRVRIQIVRKGKVGSRATPRIALTASEACRVTVTARVGRVRLERVRTPLRGGRRTILRLRPSRAGATKIRRTLGRHRRATLVVSVSARDAAGNAGRVSRRMMIRRG